MFLERILFVVNATLLSYEWKVFNKSTDNFLHLHRHAIAGEVRYHVSSYVGTLLFIKIAGTKNWYLQKSNGGIDWCSGEKNYKVLAGVLLSENFKQVNFNDFQERKMQMLYLLCPYSDGPKQYVTNTWNKAQGNGKKTSFVCQYPCFQLMSKSIGLKKGENVSIVNVLGVLLGRDDRREKREAGRDNRLPFICISTCHQ